MYSVVIEMCGSHVSTRPARIRGRHLDFAPNRDCNKVCDMVESMLRGCAYGHIPKQFMRIRARIIMNTAVKRVYIDVPESGVNKLKDFVAQNGWNLTIIDRMSLLKAMYVECVDIA